MATWIEYQSSIFCPETGACFKVLPYGDGGGQVVYYSPNATNELGASEEIEHYDMEETAHMRLLEIARLLGTVGMKK